MFNMFFSKRKVKKSKLLTKNGNVDSMIFFKDLKNQDISINIDESNNTLSLIFDSNSIVLSQEQCYILSLILNEYGIEKSLIKTIDIFKEKEGK